MSKNKVNVVDEGVEVGEVDLSHLTTDCHGVEYAQNGGVIVDVVRAHTMVDIFDLYHDQGKEVRRIWVLGGKLNPKLAKPEIVFK